MMDTIETIEAQVKSYNPVRGFGFVRTPDIDRDIFLHRSVVDRYGLGPLSVGDRLICKIQPVPRGFQVTSITSYGRIDAYGDAVDLQPVATVAPTQERQARPRHPQDWDARASKVEVVRQTRRAPTREPFGSGPSARNGLMSGPSRRLKLNEPVPSDVCESDQPFVDQSFYDTIIPSASRQRLLVSDDQPSVGAAYEDFDLDGSKEIDADFLEGASVSRPAELSLSSYETPRRAFEAPQGAWNNTRDNLSESGVMKWFDRTKGFGFVVDDRTGRDVFMHVTALTRSGFSIDEAPEPGNTLVYSTKPAPNGKDQAQVDCFAYA